MCKSVQLQTATMGGVAVPSDDELRKMHAGQYVLRACRGAMSRVPVEKVKLPGQLGEEGGATAKSHDGTVYVGRQTIMCKSTDGGRSWTSHERAPEPTFGFFQILGNGTLIGVSHDRPDGKFSEDSCVHVWVSKDEGRTSEQLSDIQLPTDPFAKYLLLGLYLMSEGTLVCRVKLYGIKSTGKDTLMLYRSTDSGRTWQGPHPLADWSSEGGIVATPSGTLLATLRYQREGQPGDPLPTDERGFKHVFLADSPDRGLTWQDLRPLTTVHGQCYGCPVVQSDGTVVVIHDTRYGPGHRGSRALVSYDEGKTWADEVYYLTYTEDRAEPSFSVVLGNDTILSIVGADTTFTGPIDLFAVRWRPVKDKN